MSRIQNAITNTFFGFLVKIYQAFLPFIMRTVMLHTLGIGYLGLNGLFASVLQVLSIGDLGISGAIVYSMYEPVAKKDTKKLCALLRLYRMLYALIGLVIFLLGVAMIPVLPKLVSSDVPPDINIYILYGMYLVSTALSYSVFSYRSSLLEVYQRNYVISKINLVTMTVQFALQIAFLLLFKNYYIYILTQFTVQIINQVAVYLSVRKYYPEIKPEGKIESQMMKAVFHKVKGLLFGKISGIILHASDTIVISMFLGLTSLAVYQNYFFLITAIVGFVSTMMSGSMAGIGNSIVTETKEKIYHNFKRFTFILSWIVCVCTNCFLTLFQPFMTIWMGEDMLLPMSMVVLFCLYFFIYEYNQLFNLFKDAAGLWYEDRFRPLITSLVNLFLNLFFINRIGLYGIIASTVISILFVGMPWLIHNLFHMLFQRKVSEYLKELAKYIAVTLASCVITFSVTNRMNCGGFIGLFLYAAIAVCIPSCMYIIIFRKNEHFQNIMDFAKKLVLKKDGD